MRESHHRHHHMAGEVVPMEARYRQYESNLGFIGSRYTLIVHKNMADILHIASQCNPDSTISWEEFDQLTFLFGVQTGSAQNMQPSLSDFLPFWKLARSQQRRRVDLDKLKVVSNVK